MFSALPPKADLPPDLRTTPAASSCGERRHRGLARRLVVVRRRVVFVIVENERPHPRRADGRRMHLENTADDNAFGEHVEVIIVLVAGGSVNRRDCVETRP